ncbi:hypothetical protein RRG08_025604 [Elysia crispata]|uniref:Uncharacterized protein n=1 Tax=Elysia crispata TaxID=231223 RepID=A0AAE1CXS9_9GAST|nr:hypothetical protein RRG08_025604 [Elysia crispata]
MKPISGRRPTKVLRLSWSRGSLDNLRPQRLPCSSQLPRDISTTGTACLQTALSVSDSMASLSEALANQRFPAWSGRHCESPIPFFLGTMIFNNMAVL